MATTGFWPVKSRLKEVIDYADNPDKTTERKYLDDDLAVALTYAENDTKTDQKMYVSGINCITAQAYEQMMATKQRYGKIGGNVGYHSFQSFRTGEVTPEEAHQIGIETARAMWGSEYEIVVTTHLNTDNIHNHMVVNSVSFRTGRKFENHISDHYRLRELSDKICREHGKSVLRNSNFYSNKKEYWIHESGQQTHRDILKRDIEEAIRNSTYWKEFSDYLQGLGYSFQRGNEYKHLSVIAPGWKRAVRIDSLGEKYTEDTIRDRLIENQYNTRLYSVRPYKPKLSPLLSLEKELGYEVIHSHDTATVLIDMLFLILIELLEIAMDTQERPHSPLLRQALTNEKQLRKEYYFMKQNYIHTEKDLVDYIDNCSTEIDSFEHERQNIRNSNRRPKTDEERQMKNTAAQELSEKLKPLRANLKTAKSAYERYPTVWNLLITEKSMELDTLNNQRNKNTNRSYVR